MTDIPPSDTRPTRRRLDGSFIFLIAFAAVSGLACLVLKGPDAAWRAMVGETWLLLQVLPTLVGGILLAAFLQVLTPVDLIRKHLGAESGLRGIVTVIPFGLVLPGGPMVSLPLFRTMMTLGADFGVCAAFYTSWTLLGVTRLMVWDVPLLGGPFTLLRLLVSAPMPLLVGLVVTYAMRRRKPAASG